MDIGCNGLLHKEKKAFVLIGIIFNSLILIFSIYILVSSTIPTKETKTISAKWIFEDQVDNYASSYTIDNVVNNYTFLGLENYPKKLETKLLEYGCKNFEIYVSPDGKKYCSKVVLPNESIWCIDNSGYRGDNFGNVKCSKTYYSCR